MNRDNNYFPAHENEKPQLIKKGDSVIHDLMIYEILKIPSKTDVFHFNTSKNTSKILLAINYLGGMETRSIGDTCRMFFKLRIAGRPDDYYFWDGIVPGHLVQLGDYFEEIDVYKSSFIEINKLFDKFGFMHSKMNCGLITGKMNSRVVLVEKIPL